MSEVHDRHETLSDWRRPDGSQPELGALPFMEDELCPPDAFEDLEPDEQYFHEATGNEGASFERTYRRAALVLWPRARRLAVLNQAGWPSLCPTWANWPGAGLKVAKVPHRPCGVRRTNSPATCCARGQGRSAGIQGGPARSDAATLLTLLSQLQDTARIDTFLDILAAGAYSKGDNAAIVRAAGLLPPERAAALLEHLIASQAATNLSACDLLARSVAARVTGRAADLSRAATALVEALPGDPARTPRRDPWSRSLPVEPGFLVDLLTALGQIDVALADRAVDCPGLAPDLRAGCRPRPRCPGSDRAGGPSGRGGGAAPAHGGPGAPAPRIAEPLEPPRDWARASAIACSCAHCRELSRFLADPDRQRWTFKALKPGAVTWRSRSSGAAATWTW